MSVFYSFACQITVTLLIRRLRKGLYPDIVHEFCILTVNTRSFEPFVWFDPFLPLALILAEYRLYPCKATHSSFKGLKRD